MAWLSGLANKAEHLLNKIDQNTAAVLNKDTYDAQLQQIPEVTWIRDGIMKDLTDNSNKTIQCSLPVQPVTENLGTSIPIREGWERLSETTSLSDHSNQVFLMDKEENGFTDNGNCDLLIEEKVDTAQIQNAHVLEKKETNDKRDNTMKTPFAIPSADKNMLKSSVEIQTEFGNQNGVLGEWETDHQKQIVYLKEKLASTETEKSQLSARADDLMSALEKSRVELSTMRSELELHRARALKTLKEKEKLIAELRCNSTKDTNDTIAMELNQIRQEREALREENQHICEQLRTAREELAATEVKLEKMKTEMKEAEVQTQELLSVEKRKRMDAEEDAKLHSEEIRSLKEESIRQRNSFTLQLRKQESELSRLRLQLSATATPSSEVESRLATLTQTLVLKQQALEHLTTERNALRLQLEKLENEYRNYVGNTRRNVSYSNGNDTDDAKAQIPMFLIETPFDTSVARRVKRAYSSLDAISIRTGVFLRRYPLARILVFIYMALLQFWVLIVLLSQSPDVH